MAMRCAILDDYQNVALGLADWGGLRPRVEVEVFTAPFATADDAIEALADFAIIAMMRERTPFPRRVIEALPRLRLLITTGAANRAIDVAACAERGITVCGTGGFGNPTTGVMFGLLLELTRRIGFESARMKAGEAWQVTLGEDIEGKTLGLFGLGKLGARVAGVGQAFGMNVMAWSQNLTAEKCAAVGVEYAAKDDLCARADVISIHLQLSDRTRGLIGARELGLMKKTAYLINTSRGPIVDEAALIGALTARAIAGAGLDVFDVEPLAREHPLRKLDNVVLTPHLGYVSRQNYARYYPDIVEDIRAFLDGKPLRVIAPK
ncbi:MAG: D-2-hydroxyacid dehydrogenase family protein [Proteobacteria bacterium]|nr:D-2-hydroxyacid dehydrogenase family protein [Pseudomonadota bacterium]